MKKIYRDAFIELTAEEVIRFGIDKDFFREVIYAAQDINDETERTVIISGPEGILGAYNEHKGFWKEND